MLNIQTKLTPYNFTDKNSLSRIKYIVVHYVGAVSTAKNNAEYFASGYRGASAHYFVDETSIWQSVLDEDASWHCGGGLQGNQYHSFYQKCTNSNSIGIEMCVKKNANGWYFEPQTVQNTIDLVQHLMAKYSVPVENVIRHADVTGKTCPEPYCYSTTHDIAWKEFKAKIGGTPSVVVKDCDLVGKVVNLGSSSHLRVRDLPNTTTGKQIGQLALGDVVYINGQCENGWYRADFKNSCGVGYFSNDYIEIIKQEETVKHSYDNTVNNLIVDGITTTENMQYWERVFAGNEPVNLDFLRTLFDRYHNTVN